MKLGSKKVIAYMIGLLILSAGISFIIKSNLGTGAWDALNVGLSKKIGLTVGTWLIIIGSILIIINAILLKTKPDIVSMLTNLIVGIFIDFWLYVIHWNPNALVWKLTLFVIGLVIASLGVSLYVQAEFAITPVDKLMYSISKVTGLNFMYSKTIGEVMALLLAYLVNGPIGLGTLLFTFLYGPCIQMFLPIWKTIFRTRQTSLEKIESA